MSSTIQKFSTITCPQCGAQTEEEMPDNACVYFWQCPQCKALLKPNEGDCCVYCSYGSVPCPPVQRASLSSDKTDGDYSTGCCS